MKIDTRHHKSDACALLKNYKIPTGIFPSVSSTALLEIRGLIEECHMKNKRKEHC